MGVSTNQERESQQGKESEQHSIELTSIKVKKETAELLRIYCVFNNKKMTDFVSEILQSELTDFQKRLAEWKKFR